MSHWNRIFGVWFSSDTIDWPSCLTSVPELTNAAVVEWARSKI